MSEQSTVSVDTLGQSAEINFDELPEDQINAIIESGGEFKPAVKEDVAEETKAVEPVEEVEEETEEVKADEASEEIAFKFTENADDETFLAEADEFINAFEDSPEIAQIKGVFEQFKEKIAARDEKLKEVESLGDLGATRRFMAGLDEMVTKHREEDPGVFVPDTTAVRREFKTNYPNEFNQLLTDELSEPSAKYQGATLMQEVLFDHFGFTSPQEQASLEHFLSTKGQTVTPPYAPPGVEPDVMEAFWKAVDRHRLEEKLRELNETLADEESLPFEKESAKKELAEIQARLVNEQKGINAARAQEQEVQRQQIQRREQFESKVMENYQNTAITLEREFGEKIASKLKMFGGEEDAAAKLTGRSYAVLASNALSESDAFAVAAREDLKKLGVNFDWSKGRESLDRLYEIEKKITYHEATNKNPRALEIAKREKADALRAIKAQETELVGKILSIAQTGANNALTKSVQNAPKFKASRIKPKGTGASPLTVGKDGDPFAGLTDAELDKYIEAKQMLAQQQGY